MGEREREKHQCVVVSCIPLNGDQAHSPGMCPDWESNQVPFGSQAGAQSTEPHQPGAHVLFKHRVTTLCIVHTGTVFRDEGEELTIQVNNGQAIFCLIICNNQFRKPACYL